MASLYELQQQGQQSRTGDPVLDEATRINESAQQVYDRIRGNATLSDEGKRRQIAAAFTETQRRLAAHKTTADAARADRVQRLTRTAFGVPTDPVEQMSYRQARQIAESIDDPTIAAQKMQSALLEGDGLLAKALARHAIDQRDRLPGLEDPTWGGVLDSYTAAVPSAGDALNQLTAAGTQDQLVEFLYFLSPKPSELDRLQDHQIDALAAENLGG